MNLPFWAELKRRKVVRVAIVYLVVAWAAIQVADTIAPRVALPNWTVTLVIVLAALGFPIALIFAWIFDITPQGIERTAEVAGAPTAALPPMRRGLWLVLSVAVALTGGWYLWSRRAPASDESLNANLIAVLPFRVNAADASLTYLREGMIDLLAAKLTGEGGPRAVDPRALMSAWKRAVANPADDLTTEPARALAQRLGAGLVLQGEVVGSASRLTLSATLLDAKDGRERARGTADGPPDSLAAIIDRLAVQLVARIAGGEQLAELTSTSLPALQAYLRGQNAFRRGAHGDADAEFQRAFAADTTFALAAAGAVTNSLWMIALGRPAAADTAYTRAWRLREHLSERDRALVTAIAGSRYPQRTAYVEQLRDAERAVALAPDRPDAWWWWADQLFHNGWFAGVSDAHARAQDAFVHAIELDSAHAPSLIHLTDLAANQGDTAALRRYSTALLVVDSVGDFSDFVRWRRASGLRDSTELRAILASLPRWSSPNLGRIIYYATLDGNALEDADMAALALRAKPGLASGGLTELRDYALNRGRPQEALRTSREMQRQSPLDHSALRFVVSGALYDGMDSTAAAAAVRDLQAHADAPLSADADTRLDQLDDLAVVAEWQAWHGNIRAARAVMTRLRQLPPRAALLEAMIAVFEKTPDAAARLAALDSVLLHDTNVRFLDNLIAARLQELQGNLPAALAAARRRIHNAPGRSLVAAFLREEGRLAALTGDRVGAIRAYRHYLNLRSDPEPGVKAEVERVRAELARLTAERS